LASSTYPIVSLVTADARLGRDFLRWMQPYAVVGRVFPSGQALLQDPDGANTQLLVLAPAAPDLSLRDLLGQLRRHGEADVICLDEQGDVAGAVSALRTGALDIVDTSQAEIALVRHVQRILGNGLPRSA
jgi:FixJ family two-component response regulator